MNLHLTNIISGAAVGSSGSVQPHSAPVSRSGRLIKPPLEYWRGGRITVGPDMNVTVHEDYTSTSILLTVVSSILYPFLPSV